MAIYPQSAFDTRKKTVGARSNATGPITFRPGMHAGDVASLNRGRRMSVGQTPSVQTRQQLFPVSTGPIQSPTVSPVLTSPVPSTQYGPPTLASTMSVRPEHQPLVQALFARPTTPHGFLANARTIQGEQQAYARGFGPTPVGPHPADLPQSEGYPLLEQTMPTLARQLASGNRTSYGMNQQPHPAIDADAVMQTFRQAQHTTPQYAMQANYAGGGFGRPGQTPQLGAPPADRPPLTVADVSKYVPGVGNRYVPSGNMISQYQRPQESSTTRVVPGLYGPRLIGEPMTPDRRDTSLAAQEARTALTRKRQADVREFQKNRYANLPLHELERIQQKHGRTFGLPLVGSKASTTARDEVATGAFAAATDDQGNVDHSQALKNLFLSREFQSHPQAAADVLRHQMTQDEFKDLYQRTLNGGIFGSGKGSPDFAAWLTEVAKSLGYTVPEPQPQVTRAHPPGHDFITSTYFLPGM